VRTRDSIAARRHHQVLAVQASGRRNRRPCNRQGTGGVELDGDGTFERGAVGVRSWGESVGMKNKSANDVVAAS
jgi:hypothetical protein